MSTPELVELGEALTDFKAQSNALLQGYQDHATAYDALAANLKGVVSSEMLFTGTVDPNDPSPTEINGGTFNTIADLVDAAPNGARIDATLVANSVNLIDRFIYLHNQYLHVRTENDGVAGKATVKPAAYVDADNTNSFYAFVLRGSRLEIHYADVDLTTDRANLGLPWNTARNTLVHFRQAAHASISLARSDITGLNSAAIANCVGAHTVMAGFELCTFDGPVIGVRHVNQGIATVADWSVTLNNGALLTESATLGTNLLNN